MNLPNNDKAKKEIPPEAEGNPVYDQTRQDMPLWCCGRNCGRNTRVFVIVMTLLAIGCSIWTCLSPHYFSFEAKRNDTFYDTTKYQPEPFQYATKADVGLFKYKITEVFVYPWPLTRERELFDALLLEEIRRLDEGDAGNGTDTGGVDSNSTVTPVTTEAPTTASPTAAPCDEDDGSVGPGSHRCGFTGSPTTPPTPAPTKMNLNDLIAQEVEIGKVEEYENGMEQFHTDSSFKNAQKGAVWAPILAFIGTCFGLVEICCCVYKCSWLPTALFLYAAFMFQLFTMFLFLSEHWCKYEMDCALGHAGLTSAIATFIYFLCQSLVCCTPRPEPFFKCCKKPPVRRKKKKKKKDEDNPDDENAYRDDPDEWGDEPYDQGYVDPYNMRGDDNYDDKYDDGQDPASNNDYYDNQGADDYDNNYDNNDYNQGGDGYGNDYDNAGYDQPYDNSGYDQNDPNSGYYDNGGYDDGQYADGQYGDGQYADGQYDDGQYGDGQYDNGQYDDGQYDNNQYDGNNDSNNRY